MFRNMSKIYRPSAVSRIVLIYALKTYLNWHALSFMTTSAALSFALHSRFGDHYIDNKDLSNLLLTYNSLVLSFSLASITIVIALPSEKFVSFLSRERKKAKSVSNPFRNLILCFFQAAFSHYVALIAVSVIFLVGPEKLSPSMILNYQFWWFYMFTIQAWAFVLFGVALRDIASLGVIYATFLSNSTRSEEPTTPPETPR